MPKMSVMGYELSLQKQAGSKPEDKAKIQGAIEILKKYKAGKENLEQKIIENERWYKMQHWDIIRQKKQDASQPEPITAYLFNTLANKHADAMDNYPEANMLPREENDVDEAKNLSEVVPVVIERNNFRQTYDDGWWYKLKHGTAVYGTFWNFDLENGIGDIDIQNIDLLNVYWEPGVKNIQKSRNLFITALVDNDVLAEQYKDVLPANFASGNGGNIEVKQYIFDDNVDISNKSVVVDWYYKKNVSVVPEARGRTVLHMTKFVGQYMLESTESDEEYAQTGLYLHGEYPVEFDVLFPEEGSPVGFGYIDVIKNPQMYIDKLDQIISRNALVAGKQRFLVKENAVNENELLDYSIDVVHANGSLNDDNFRILQAEPLHPFVVEHRREKIAELKETSGVNDVSRGEAGKGVTAASAIMALQEAGSKLSRDMIQRSYNTFSRNVYKVIELIRQFYGQDRAFRIDQPTGQPKFTTYNNRGLQEQALPTMYEGEEPKYRKPVFDIKVKPERQTPFSRVVHNEMAKELYSAGFFNPQMAPQALVALDMMQFEGKDAIIQKVSQNGQLFQQMQLMQQQMMRMAAALQKVTGEDLGMGDAANGGAVA
jgi:hypothetical protein